jgi:hypothetical protein
MRLLYLLYIISAKVSSIKSSEYSSKGMIPSYDKIPVETVEIPDVLKREHEQLIIPYITRKSATNNK